MKNINIKDIIYPVRFKLLIQAVKIPEKTKSGLYLGDAFKKAQARFNNVGLVVDMGSECYTPPEKFPHGPLCKIGDWIYYDHYERIDLELNDEQFYLIHDDKVSVIVKNVSSILSGLYGIFSEEEIIKENDFLSSVKGDN